MQNLGSHTDSNYTYPRRPERDSAQGPKLFSKLGASQRKQEAESHRRSFARLAFGLLHRYLPRKGSNGFSERLNVAACVAPRKDSRAFTLAEVLITLGIIGVVAAMTIPTLMKNVQDIQYKSAYKKAYSAFSQALFNANTDSLLIEAISTSPRPTDFDKNFLAIMSEFKIVKQCTSGSDGPNCWDSTGEQYRVSAGGYPNSNAYSFIDSTGMAWTEYYSGSSAFFVDTNGFNKPNQWGKDRFSFYLRDINGSSAGTPAKVGVFQDNGTNICDSNKCGTEHNYYGTTWMMN